MNYIAIIAYFLTEVKHYLLLLVN